MIKRYNGKRKNWHLTCHDSKTGEKLKEEKHEIYEEDPNGDFVLYNDVFRDFYSSKELNDLYKEASFFDVDDFIEI